MSVRKTCGLARTGGFHGWVGRRVSNDANDEVHVNDAPLIPKWIRKIKAQDDLTAAKIDGNAQRQLLAQTTVQADGPAFWKQLLKELKLATDGLALIELHGSLANFETVLSSDEEARHIAISISALLPKQTYTNVFYKPGGSYIRCHTQEGESVNLRLCLYEGTVRALAADGRTPMDAELCAQAIVQPMVAKVRA
jgi:hypothetical protein